jgi:aspartyl-tRNA(Asn)/glutamyl-tRNA(Gln) amidotransferase subunit C
MILSLEEVEHIAELAKLALTDEEKARYREQLSAILDYANRLQAVDTGDIPPTASVLPVDTVLREDVSRPGVPRDDLLENAADQADGMFRVEAIWDESP